jgi:hypothetical protein
VGIDQQARVEHQLCVPAIAIEGESYRLKEARERADQRTRQRRGTRS